MHAPILLLARRHFETGQWTSQQLKEKVKEVQLILMEAKSILFQIITMNSFLLNSF